MLPSATRRQALSAGLATATSVGLSACFAAPKPAPTKKAIVRITAPRPTGVPAKDQAALVKAVGHAVGKRAQLVLQKGVYAVDSLQLPSGTDIDLNGATIRQVRPSGGSALGAAVRNADFDGGNATIRLQNGVIDLGEKARGRMLAFVRVKGLQLRGLQLRKAGGDFTDWMMFVRESDQVVIDGCSLSGATELGEDGIHLEGCSRTVVSDCDVSAGDDAIAIVQLANCARATSSVQVTNCRIASRSAYLIRCSVFKGERHGIRNVRISGIKGALAADAVGSASTIDDANLNGMITGLAVSDVTVSSVSPVSGGFRISGLRQSALRDISVAGVQGRSFDVQSSEDVTFTGCAANVKQSAASDSWWIQDGVRLTFTSCTDMNSTASGFVVNGSGSQGIVFTDCRSISPKGYGFAFFGGGGDTVMSGCVTTSAGLGRVGAFDVKAPAIDKG